MGDNVTLLRPDVSPPSSERGLSSWLPSDLLEQIRSRVRLLALFLTIGFAIDPAFYFVTYGAAVLAHVQLPNDFFTRMPARRCRAPSRALSSDPQGTARPRVEPANRGSAPRAPQVDPRLTWARRAPLSRFFGIWRLL